MKQALLNKPIAHSRSAIGKTVQKSGSHKWVLKSGFALLAFILVSTAALASHFKGGQITYKYLGGGQYDMIITGYWDKDAVESIQPFYEGAPKLNTPSLTVSKTLLPDGKTIEHVQKQRLTWSKPGLYQVSWKSCCRIDGSNFGSEQNGLFAAVNYNPDVASSSPQFYDVPIFNFDIDGPVNYNLNMEDAEGHEQEYSLEVPFGLSGEPYRLMTRTGFRVSNDGSVSWTRPMKGLWLVNVKLREKIDGQYTGAFVLRDFILNITDSENEAPVFAQVQPQTIKLGETLNFEVVATDAAGQNVNLKASSSVFEKGASFAQTATGSTSRGAFTWTPGAIGTYNVQFTATDDNLVPLSSQVIVPITVISATDPCAVAVSAAVEQQPCAGASTGQVRVSGSNGTAPYAYSLDGGHTFQNSNLFEGLSAGTYTALVKDAAGCTSQTTAVEVTANPLPTVSFNQRGVSVCESAAPFALSGASPEGGIYSGAFVDNGLFNPALAGPGRHLITYTYTNSNGCTSTATQFIVVNAAPVSNAGADKTVYFGYKNYNCTTLSGSATGGNSAYYTYSWSTGETTASISVCPTATTTYTLTITDASGCTSTDEVTVEVVDVRCGNKKKLDKVVVCHKGKPICIAPAAVAAHLAHGDVLGDCSTTGSDSSSAIADSEEVAEEEATEAELLLYPNPINDKGQITLKLKEADYVVLDIVDMNGKVVTKLFEGEAAANQEMTFNVNRSIGNKNIYIGRLSTSKGTKFIKLVITQ